jgi:hypothetical protein
MSFISLAAASPAAVAAGGGALLISSEVTPATQVIGWTLLATATGLLVSMLHAINSAKPTAFEFVGNTPAYWLSDVTSKQSLKKSLCQQLEHYAGMISTNGEILKRNADRMHKAIWWTWSSLVFGGVLSAVALAERRYDALSIVLSWVKSSLSYC